MTFANTLLPFLSSTLTLIFSLFVFIRFFRKGGAHLLVWSIGLLMYSLGGFCEGWNGAFGWNPLVFRLWYLFGALLVAAWLGQGTVYLLAKPRTAHIAMAILGAASVYGAIRVFSAQLDPSLMIAAKSLHTGSELSGHAIVTPGVRLLTPFFNTYGTLTLVGGAIYSSYIFFRKKVLPNRAVGNVLIALGSLLPAFGGAFSRFGIPNALYLTEFLGAILIFVGFLRAVSTPKAPKEAKAQSKP